MKHVLIIGAKFVFGSISFQGGFLGKIFGLFMILWGVYDIANLTGMV